MSKRLLHTPEGVRDIYGKEYHRKQFVEEGLRKVIRTYGYEGIQTPAFEFFDVFGKEIGTTPGRELYKFFDKEGETLVLRPDFTPSVARCAAKYFMDESKPLRFFYNGNTFSNSSSLQGKLNEVTQLGAELINDNSVEADAEMISMVIEALKSVGLEHFQISIGQEEYFRGLCEEAGLDTETELQLREYISGKNYFAAQELLSSGCVSADYCEKLLKAADIFGSMGSPEEARKLVNNKRSIDAIEQLLRLQKVLAQYDALAYVSFDLGMLSKYHYYTGMTFKVFTYGIGNALVKGGRYDNLLSQFGKNASAVGFVIVIDDLLEALSRQKVTLPEPPSKQVIAYTQDDFSEKLAQARELRSRGIIAELIRKGDSTHE